MTLGNNASFYGGLQYTFSTGELRISQVGGGSLGTTFYTAGSERMRIDSSTGNVGIGTSSPTAKLDVSSSSAGVTAGDFVVDTANKTVFVGRQSSTDADNSTFIVRGRVGTQIMKVDASTQTVQTRTTISVGNATPAASGAGITFPATQSASSDVNTLDDYEEGTWTPSLGGTTTYNGRTGIYTKIGRLVYIQCYLDVNLIGTGSVSTISGLPFASENISGAGMCSYFASLNINLVGLGFFGSGSTLRNSGLATAAATASVDNAIFKNATRVDFSMTYITT
jgi:hypothetical protein